VNSSHQTLISWNEECVQLLEKLSLLLDQEREALVSFNMEQIMTSTVEKAAVVKQLSDKRNQLRKYVQVRFGKPLSDLSQEFSPEWAALWNESQRKWSKGWNRLVRQCEGNQGFLKHSLKNVDLLLNHLKHLFGDPGIYNQSGKRQDLSSSGKVLEGQF